MAVFAWQGDRPLWRTSQHLTGALDSERVAAAIQALPWPLGDSLHTVAACPAALTTRTCPNSGWAQASLISSPFLRAAET